MRPGKNFLTSVLIRTPALNQAIATPKAINIEMNMSITNNTTPRKTSMLCRFFTITLAVLSLFVKTSNTFATTDLKWLLEYSDKNTNSVIWDERFDKTLGTHVPKVEVNIGLGEAHPLANGVYAFIGGPPEEVTLSDNRYMTLAGCRHHSCPEKAWIWIDLQENLVVGALVHYVWDGNYSSAPSLLVFS